MRHPLQTGPLFAVLVGLALLGLGCRKAPEVPVALAPPPPGPTDLGPAGDLPAPPEGAVVFDLAYRPQMARDDDIPYFSFWGYGGSTDVSAQSPFIQDVRRAHSGLYAVMNASLKGREWSAVEYQRQQATALFFDVDGNGKFSPEERLLPSRRIPEGFEFITPDFLNPGEGGRETLSRVLLRVNFYGRNSEPNCMWSPAALLAGEAQLAGRPVRLLLFASHAGGPFDAYGATTFALLDSPSGVSEPEPYIPREACSSLVRNGDHYYRFSFAGRRTNGLPARVILVEDQSPRGELGLTLAGSQPLQARIPSLSLQGVDDKSIFLRVASAEGRLSLPVGTYALTGGQLEYGGAHSREWLCSFSSGPRAAIQAGAAAEVELGNLALKVRAIEESRRYDSEARESSTFKRATRIYFEPRIVGRHGELLTRFAKVGADGKPSLQPPRIRITGPDGKERLSTVMEYG